MPQITFLALLAALIAFIVTNPTKAQDTTDADAASAPAVQDGTQATPQSMDDAYLISDKARLMRIEAERRQKIIDDAVQ